ncbi:MAG: hypothetical protein LBJ08_06850, partial [Bifidobacteriaceae bacterium]|nr:hypothetical protein [Bifidobacteriaceae bacterium]
MAFLAHLNRSASPGICALILFFAPLHALSNARAEAVEDGPSVTASAVYDLTRYPESLLDPVSDGALR